MMRDAVKTACRFLAHVFVFPALLWHWLWLPFLGPDRCIEDSTQWLSLVPGVIGNYLRNAFLSWTIRHCAPSATISFGTTFSKANARVDELAYVGPGCHLGLVHLEKEVLVAAGVHITSGSRTHGFDDPDKSIREQEGSLELVTIGARSWIGSGAIVMASVGKNSIVGAGAVVTKPIPDHVIAVGVPAKVVQQRAQPNSQ